jgi:multimeric flavodoxin WrbA
MKVLGVLGSPRIKGNSDILLDQALAGAKDAGAEIEKIILVKKKISGCLDCKKCNETGVCVIEDDMQEIHKKILDADAIIHSVPVYFFSMTAQMKAYLDRWCAFCDEAWSWQEAYLPKMKGKKIGVITVCAAPDVSIADPIVHSFKMTAKYIGDLNFFGTVQVSAREKGAVNEDEQAKKEAYELGKKAITL